MNESKSMGMNESKSMGMNESKSMGMNESKSMGNQMGMNESKSMSMNESKGTSESSSKAQVNSHSNTRGCATNTIFVDLPCYMNKMNNLSEHSDNMMVDLSLLTSNLKACSYIKKGPKNEQELQDKKKYIPTQDTIKIANMPAQVLVTSNSPSNTDNNMVVGLTKEPFDVIQNTLNTISYGWWDTYYVKLIVLLLILYVVMNKQ